LRVRPNLTLEVKQAMSSDQNIKTSIHGHQTVEYISHSLHIERLTKQICPPRQPRRRDATEETLTSPAPPIALLQAQIIFQSANNQLLYYN